MPVPFGFGVGDFVGVGTLVWKIYNAYAGAPEQFRNFSGEILSLHVVVRKIEDQLGMSGSEGGANSNAGPSRLPGCGSITSLSEEDKNALNILYDGLQTTMKELDNLLKKYQTLASNPIMSFDRLKWGKEDLASLRERILLSVSLLTAFNASLE
ncbi:hypothetical protein EV426DRAFT_645852, partial [Tirmania nivea]